MVRIHAAAKEEARAKLLESAARHFAAEGLDGASVDRISLDAGYAKGTVYNYFESKEALFGAVIAEGARRAASRYAAMPPVAGGTRARLLAAARADLAVLREDEPFVKVIVREAMSFRPSTYPLVVEHLAPYAVVLEGILAEGVRRGEVRPEPPAAELALVFVGLLALHYVQHWGSGGVWPALDAIPERVVSLFLEGAAPPRPEAVP